MLPVHVLDGGVQASERLCWRHLRGCASSEFSEWSCVYCGQETAKWMSGYRMHPMKNEVLSLGFLIQVD